MQPELYCIALCLCVRAKAGSACGGRIVWEYNEIAALSATQIAPPWVGFPLN